MDKEKKDVQYRFDLAAGFLAEAEDDFQLKRWRSCVSGSILSIENAGLAVLMLFGVSRLTHHPDKHLPQLLAEGTVSEEIGGLIEQLIPELERHDSHEKMLVKYGREPLYMLPWQIFTEKEASEALEGARKSVSLLGKLMALMTVPPR
ncbi:hypothetical protein [Chlorobium phaeobacteroides]|jgi:HEPN domain-containing protein|uniref:HEPN domain-containing protein n=1 Tax=Chlorobium phaeobacteroides (strain DSM 266 / SMG 266 / 2430) TaxID=290317 RepID=A1BHY0_CHLPD|nr:hypothetical protein [Chlorobium phaeobacteroides]ABL66007.1 conserved hypothetical protein [Chlorobium phaeobacteroides DSM 266]MBV5326487.1 hypothetical protein [Chlorobium sp.]